MAQLLTPSGLWVFFLRMVMRNWGREEGANLATTVSLNPVRQNSFSDCSFLLVHHICRGFPSFTGWLAEQSGQSFTLRGWHLCGSVEQCTCLGSMHDACLLSCLFNRAGCLSCLGGLDWWEAAAESASLVYCGQLTVTVCLQGECVNCYPTQ